MAVLVLKERDRCRLDSNLESYDVGRLRRLPFWETCTCACECVRECNSATLLTSIAKHA
jgi:hypothetical protein